MDGERYLAHLADDAALLLACGRRDLDAPVPSCPGWTMTDLLWHVAIVYRHKVECMRRGASPTPWPPSRTDEHPVDVLQRDYDDLVAELRTRGPDAPSYTWHAPDQTVGFWYRRMTHETAIHRVDAQLALGAATPVDAVLAADGVDEMLDVMLSGDYSDLPVPGLDSAVRLHAGGREWLVHNESTWLTVARDPPTDLAADAVLSVDPSTMDLWLWGRAPQSDLNVEGDVAAVDALRARIDSLGI